MQLLRISIIFVPLLCAAANQVHPARHYTYSGSDPARWTSSPLEPRALASTVASADFTAFPCGASSCTAAQIITDANRNTYVVGTRYFGTADNRSSDVFVAKLDPAGATVFLATLGGKFVDQGLAIAVDSLGNVVVGGTTTSPNFPLRNVIQAKPASNPSGILVTGFLAKLSPDGTQLIYSTYFGGSADSSSVNGVAIDSSGNTWATGQTGSSDFSTTPGMPAGKATGSLLGEIAGAFIAKLSPDGDKILSAGVVVGSVAGSVSPCGPYPCPAERAVVSGNAITLDSAGNVYVAGDSNVTDLPVTSGAFASQGPGAWAARINANGARVDYLTYLGTAPYGSAAYTGGFTGVTAMAVDAKGNAYLVGSTTDSTFPVTPGAFQIAHSGSFYVKDAYVAKLNPQGTAMVWATFLGGSGDDAANSIAIDSTGAAYVTGTTASSDFPVTIASKGQDFIAVLNPAGTALTYSMLYPGGSVSQGVALDADGQVRTASPTGIVSSLALNSTSGPRVFGITNGAGGTSGVSVAPGEVVSLYGMQFGPAVGVSGVADSTGKMPATLAGTQVLFDGVAAPLLYASQYQINAVAPFALSPGKGTTIRVIAGSSHAPDFPGVVVAAQPAIFVGADGAAAAVNQDGTVNSASNPAKPGSIVSIWATGVGAASPLPADGQLATGAQDYRCCTVNLVEEGSLDVLYAGAAPGMVSGVVQINFRVPVNVGGATPFTITTSGTTSPSAWIWVAH